MESEAQIWGRNSAKLGKLCLFMQFFFFWGWIRWGIIDKLNTTKYSVDIIAANFTLHKEDLKYFLCKLSIPHLKSSCHEQMIMTLISHSRNLLGNLSWMESQLDERQKEWWCWITLPSWSFHVLFRASKWIFYCCGAEWFGKTAAFPVG